MMVYLLGHCPASCMQLQQDCKRLFYSLDQRGAPPQGDSTIGVSHHKWQFTRGCKRRALPPPLRSHGVCMPATTRARPLQLTRGCKRRALPPPLRSRGVSTDSSYSAGYNGCSCKCGSGCDVSCGVVRVVGSSCFRWCWERLRLFVAGVRAC